MKDGRILDGRILIVDDEFANCRLLERMLRQAGYQNVVSTTDSRRVLPLCGEFQPDLILLDLLMPHLDGFAVMEHLAPSIEAGACACAFVPVIILTADVRPEIKNRALGLGAADFVTKPFEQVEVTLRIRNALRTRLLLLRQQDQLELILQSRNALYARSCSRRHHGDGAPAAHQQGERQAVAGMFE